MDTNQTIIDSVRAWQGYRFVHPLTCGNDSTHAKLEPVEEQGQVILVCPTCDYRQDRIPQIVLDVRLPGGGD